MPAQCCDQGLQFFAPEKVGRAAAQMQLDHFPTVLEERRRQYDFVPQPLEVQGALFRVARDEAIAAAVEAGGPAVRNVHVKGDGAGDGLSVALPRVGTQLGLSERAVELGRRWIGRV